MNNKTSSRLAALGIAFLLPAAAMAQNAGQNQQSAPTSPTAPSAPLVISHLDAVLQSISDAEAQAQAQAQAGVASKNLNRLQAARIKTVLERVAKAAQAKAVGGDLSDADYARIRGKLRAIYAKYNVLYKLHASID